MVPEDEPPWDGSALRPDVRPWRPVHPGRMDTLTDARRETASRVATGVAGAAALMMAIYQVASPGPPEASYDSALDWARELIFLGYLCSAVVATVLAARRRTAPRAAARLITLGYGAVAVGVAAGMAMREDPDWFMLLGGPGNLLAMAGFVTWAVWGHRTRVLPPAVALLCGVGGVVAVLGSELGTSVLIAGFWFYLTSQPSGRPPTA